MIKYLCEAYYKINDDIVLGSSFAGLGGTSNSYVFRGVIVDSRDPTEHIQLSPITLQALSSGSAAEVL